ncbi:MAG TPA: glycosyltransferase family 4 protein [Flavisolibacter sp.]|jgi:glycosyltransferase involved in cell wall biosynthesis|nr:glycosyltransferase family 4 protein [Flavisolibacter sp.]
MRILFFSHRFYPEIGGIEVNSEVLANEFVRNGAEVKLITWTQESGTKSFPYEVIRKPGLRRLIKAHQWADVVYENNPSLRLSWPVLFTRKLHIIAIRTWIARMDGSLAIQDKLKKQWLGLADAVIAVSEAVQIKTWPKSVVIGNPYRSNLFHVLPDVTRRKKFVFLGRLVSDKGAHFAILALSQLLKKDIIRESNKGLLTIIGVGPQIKELKRLCIELGVKEFVDFRGALSGDVLVKALNEHEFLLVPSVWEEPFGNVALEGMACGCIPIVSDGGGLPDAVGEAGLVFERGNVDSLTKTLEKVLTNPEMVANLRIAAIPHLQTHLPEIVGRKYFEVIDRARSRRLEKHGNLIANQSKFPGITFKNRK